jgi:hypothetical protein
MRTLENLATERVLDHRATHHAQLLVLAVAVALAAATVAWMAVRTGGEEAGYAAGPTVLSEAQLQRLARSIDRPIFWAGPKKGYSYEVTATHGRVYVRYLPIGVSAGDPRASFLAIGTYTSAKASDLKLAATRRGSLSQRLDDGGLLVFAAKRRASVYVGFPGARYQVEVFDPSRDTARQLVLGGSIVPVR